MTPPPYTLSFTVGGLFLFEGIALAKLRAAGSPWDEVRRAVPAGVFVARGGASSVKQAIRLQAARSPNWTSAETEPRPHRAGHAFQGSRPLISGVTCSARSGRTRSTISW